MKLNKYVLALTCTFAVAAQAENNWYVLGSAGVTRAQVKEADINKAWTDAGATVNSSKIDKTDTGYKLQIGYKLMQNLAIEGGYVDLGQAEHTANLTGGVGKTDWEAKGWNINVVGIVPFTDKFSVLAKLGFIQAKVEATAHATGAAASLADSASSTHIRSIFGVGAAYAITDALSVRAEAESYSSLGNDQKTGQADVYLFSAGVSYSF